MSDFDRAFAIVVGIEAGYVNNPADPGGETKFGISKRSHPDLDIASLTIDQAGSIYQREFWGPLRCDFLPWPVNCLLFEAAVNDGPAAAAKLLQQSLHITDDGVIGPATVQAAQIVSRRELVARFQAKLGVRYAQLPTAASFLEGWLYREFLAEEQAFGG